MIIIETSSGNFLFRPWLPLSLEELPRHAPTEETQNPGTDWTWNGELLQQSLERRSKSRYSNLLPHPGYFQAFSYCLGRMHEATIRASKKEPVPINLVKDTDHKDIRMMFQPPEYQILNGRTLVDQHHIKDKQEAFQQVYSTVTLVSRVIYGYAAGQDKGIAPLFIQVPRSDIKEGTRITSEQIRILIEVPDYSVKMKLQMKQFTAGPHLGMEFVDCSITTDSALSLSEKNQWKHWENIVNEIPALIAKIQAGNSYIPRVPHHEPLGPSLVRRIATVKIGPRTKQTARKVHKAKELSMKIKLSLRRRSPRKKHTEE